MLLILPGTTLVGSNATMAQKFLQAKIMATLLSGADRSALCEKLQQEQVSSWLKMLVKVSNILKRHILACDKATLYGCFVVS